MTNDRDTSRPGSGENGFRGTFRYYSNNNGKIDRGTKHFDNREAYEDFIKEQGSSLFSRLPNFPTLPNLFGDFQGNRGESFLGFDPLLVRLFGGRNEQEDNRSLPIVEDKGREGDLVSKYERAKGELEAERKKKETEKKNLEEALKSLEEHKAYFSKEKKEDVVKEIEADIAKVKSKIAELK